MQLSKVVGWVSFVCVAVAPALAFAEQGPASEPASPSATGVLLQARLQASQSLLSTVGLSGGSGLLVGYQGGAFALGLGVGLTRIGVSGEDDTSVSGSIFQIAPTVLFDVWRSAGGDARANVLASVGYGRASLSATASTEDCVIDPLTGNESCTSSTEEVSAGATFIPVTLGVGGDYFLGRNFALGVEVGAQLAFVTGIDAESGGTSESIDASANWQATYGLLRASFVIGD